MRRFITRAAGVGAAAAALCALGLTGVSAAARAPRPAQPDRATARPSAGSGARLWVARYNGPGNGDDVASALAVSPDGKRVYVTGTSLGTTGNDDYATIAYSAATGAQLWVARHNGPRDFGSSAVAVAVSPDGSRVFVTGTTQYGDDSACPDTAYDTVAYNAATGARLWSAQVCSFSSATALAVSPDGKRVYVTGGWDQECGICMLYGTAAYNAATGTAIWTRYYGEQGSETGRGSAIAVSQDGKKVYVTGSITRSKGGTDYGTIAYSAAGKQLWVRRHQTPGSAFLYLAISLAVSPAGTVVVTGYSPVITSAPHYVTIAYSAAGKQLWDSRYNGTAYSIAAPGNGKVYVTGTSQRTKSGSDYATIAYNIFSGAQLWVRLYHGPVNGTNQATAVTARDGRIFVTGGSPGTTSGLDYATIAYHG